MRFSILRKNPSDEIDNDDENYYYYYYYNKSQETTGFSRAPEIDFRYENMARKVMVHHISNALYRYVFIESLQKSG